MSDTLRRPAFARWMGQTNTVTRTFLAAARIPDMINLAGGLPAPQTYPANELAEIARSAVLEHPGDTLGYSPIEGLPELRDALAEQFSTPALRLTRANVLVTTSGMQGLDLLGKVLLDPGDVAATQFPTYLGALDAWRPHQPVYRNIHLDRAEAPGIADLAGAKFAYTVPNFSNPTGRLVPLETRRALVAAAHATGTWLIEDDPYGGLLFDGSPLPRLIDLSAEANPSDEPYRGPVIYMGTVSKQISPGLRVGWIVAAPEMIEALSLAKQGSDLCTSGLTQRVTLGALRSGLVARLEPQLRTLYRARRDALCAALSDHLSDLFTWDVPVGGMFVWIIARDPACNTDELLHDAMRAGVCISPSSVFDAQGQFRRAVRLNFTLNTPETLREGVRRLAVACQARAAA